MKVSVAILNWNGRKMLEQFLPSVCEHSLIEGAEVVVADNGSTDDSLSFLSASYPQVRQLPFDKNYGFAEGYNKTLEALDSEYVVLLNDDVQTSAGWLDALVRFMDANPDVVACQPKIRAFHRQNYFEHAGACGGFLDKFGYPFCRGRVFGDVEEDKGQYDTVTDVLWATGAALMVRRKEYLANGGLDADFFAHMEEIDLCWRLRSRGYRICCVPESVVYHVGGGTLNMNNPRKTFLNFRNNLLMIYKNETSVNWVLFVRFFMDYLAAASFLAKFDFANFKAVFKARWAYHKMKSMYHERREENMSKRSVSAIPEICPSSLVLDYYLRHKHTFIDWRKS